MIDLNKLTHKLWGCPSIETIFRALTEVREEKEEECMETIRILKGEIERLKEKMITIQEDMERKMTYLYWDKA